MSLLRRFERVFGTYLLVVVLFSACATAPREKTPVEFHPILGEWRREAGNYELTIDGVDANGRMAASYRNPTMGRLIGIGEARAQLSGGTISVFVKLVDYPYYPGSIYELTYDPSSDMLKGTYFHALSGSKFPVTFARKK